MKHRSTFLPLFALIALVLNAPTHANETPAPLPNDPAVRSGTLPNGLTYHLRRHGKPEGRIEFRLVHRVGSVLETEDQLGLAHFLEHMAFNGTTHFKKSELVDYLESLGMGFGADLNAYTSFDETVYMLQVPTDEPSRLEKALLILLDWSGGLLLESEEIEKERGVVIEEWRGRRGARQRIMDKFFPVIFHGSLYAERLPIGKIDVLQSFTRETLATYYRHWYRPNLTSIIAVGDIDVDALEKRIVTLFSTLKNPDDAPERVWHPVPPHADTLVATASDKEMTSSSVSVYIKHPAQPLTTEADYRAQLVDTLMYTMLNDRLAEIARKPDAPFIGAQSGGGDFVRGLGIAALNAAVKEGGHLPALRAIVAEAERARRHGFAESELNRARKNLLRSAQSMARERENLESAMFADGLVELVTRETAFTSLEKDLELHEALLPGITLDDVHTAAKSRFAETNRVVLADGPERADAPLPSDAELLAVFSEVAAMELAAYDDQTSDEPLIPQPPAAAGHRFLSEIPEIGLREFVLDNGITVLLRYTDFKDDQILMSAFSHGGHSLAPDDLFIPASDAATIASESGWGTFDALTLRKRLAGKNVGLAPYVGELEEGLAGSCSPDDLDTLFELAHLAFTAPRLDEQAIAALMNKRRESLRNRSAAPSTWFSDRMTEVMTRRHPRSRPWTAETVDRMNPQASLDFYRERFADADDFTFLFVGNFDEARLLELAGQYLGSLPVRDGAEKWLDVGRSAPQGREFHIVEKGLEPVSQVIITYHGPFEWTLENRLALNALGDAMDIRLREEIREKRGGVYSIYAAPTRSLYPRPEYRFSIVFGCEPARVQELIAAVDDIVRTFRESPPSRDLMGKVRAGMLRKREVDLKSNEFWLAVLKFYRIHNEDPSQIARMDQFIQSLTPDAVRQSARTHLNEARRAVFILKPEQAN